MTKARPILYCCTMAVLIVLVGVLQSWNVALSIVNLCIISAIMSVGVNIQWGYAGLFNAGIMGFAALGGLAAVLVSMPAVPAAWDAGGSAIIVAGLLFLATIIAAIVAHRRIPNKRYRLWAVIAIMAIGTLATRYIYDGARDAIEAIEPAKTGYLGGLGLPILLAWPVGGGLAALGAWVIGKIALRLRADYLAIATLGISEIIIAVLKNEDWLARGVKNVTGIARPVPYESALQQRPWVQQAAATLDSDVVALASIIVKLSYTALFGTVLIAALWLCQSAWRAPWGRMMRAIRDNETAAAAMGKDIEHRHLQVFVLGSCLIGIAGAMLVTLDGQFTPTAYSPLRFTFLIWVMVVVGGSGNNFGSILGGFLIWFYWVEAEPIGLWLINNLTMILGDDSSIRAHLLDNAAHMRPLTMGIILLLVMRFNPRGLIPERP